MVERKQGGVNSVPQRTVAGWYCAGRIYTPQPLAPQPPTALPPD